MPPKQLSRPSFQCRTLCAAALALFAAPAFAQAPFRTEIHPIETLTLSTADFLNGRKQGRVTTIAGELRIPTFGTGKLPAAVLVHGSGGVGSNVIEWAEVLNRTGIAVFILDTFSGRGIVRTINDQTQLASLAMLYDSYRALELLAEHPRIDPKRIAIMGFSKGGVAALYSGMTRFRRFYAPKGLAFAGHLSFYPPCSVAYIGDTQFDRMPVRIFHGAEDDWAPIAPCRDYTARLKAAGVDAVLHEYDGAHHGFDAAILRAPIKLPNAVTARGCTFVERPQGAIVNGKTGKRLTARDPCLERGTTIAHSAEATAAARRDVTQFLKELFGLQ